MKEKGDIGPGLPGFEIDGGGGGGDASARRLEADGAAVGDGANGNGSPSAGDDNNADAHASGSGEPSRLRYTILDVPPLPQALLLGFQQYLVMLGSTVLIPSVVVPPMGGSSEDLAKVVCTIFFASGIVTLLQTLLGDRLPIVQGGSFAFISPALAITAHIKATMAFASEAERFRYTMRVVSGGIMGSGLVVFGIGALGLIRPVLALISPITVAVNIAVLSLALAGIGFSGMMDCLHLGVLSLCLTILCSLYMRKLTIPLGKGRRWPVFELCPIILSLLLSWFIAWLLTIGGAYRSWAPDKAAACRTDQSRALELSPWFRVPYPGQWGAPIMDAFGTLTMLAGAIPAMIESLGDYYAAAQMSGAPTPPADVLQRAVAWQGLSCVVTGLLGTGSGTTAYNENIGAIQITRVGSRRVVQYGALIMIALGVIGKFGGLFASVPHPLMSGLFCIVFGLIAAVGLSMLAHTDQRSERNIFIVGFGLYMSLSVSQYFEKQAGTGGPISTPNAVANNVLNSLFSTAAAVALMITVLLDNTVPGTAKERGLTEWMHAGDDRGGADGAPRRPKWAWWEDDEMERVYGLPFGLTRRYERAVGARLRAWRGRVIVEPARRAAGRAQARVKAAVERVRGGRGGGGGGGGTGSAGSGEGAGVGAC